MFPHLGFSVGTWHLLSTDGWMFRVSLGPHQFVQPWLGIAALFTERHLLYFASPALPNTCLQVPVAHLSFPSPSYGRKMTHNWFLCITQRWTKSRDAASSQPLCSSSSDESQCCFCCSGMFVLLLLGAGKRNNASCWHESGRFEPGCWVEGLNLVTNLLLGVHQPCSLA